MTTSVEDPAEPLLARMTPVTRALVQELRPLILDVVPQVAEKVHLGWSVLHYKTGPSMKDVLFALVPHRAWVNLEFGDGVDLPDPAQRLEGTGKRLRHVKIRSSEDVSSPDVRTLLEVAAKHRGF